MKNNKFRFVLFWAIFNRTKFPKMNSLSKLQPTQDIKIISTIDGKLTGINEKEIIWSHSLQPLLKTNQPPQNPLTIGNHRQFIPDFTGDLYYLKNNVLKKVDLSIKELIANNVYQDSENMYTGSKQTDILLLNPLTGKLIPYGTKCNLEDDKLVMLTKTIYRLDIWDKKTMRVVNNIEFIEYVSIYNSIYNKKNNYHT